ncbi:MAG: hypothetical protein OEV78_13180 [Spirochaetia bacterium]|nr:hypothetical protein [Spirochaetia bacterium]
MKLSKIEADLFFELMWGLQFFVNQKINVLPSIKTLSEYKSKSMEEKVKVRDALYHHKELIDTFIQENPEHLSIDKLSILHKWKGYIKGDFYIERYLKKHAILIGKDEKVYGVFGLYEGLDEMIHTSHLPFLVQTVLLPFAGKIVYDGIIKSYNIDFGSGIRRDIKEIYLRAKQNNRVIESLEFHSLQKHTNSQFLINFESEINEVYKKVIDLKKSSKDHVIYDTALDLIRSSIEYAQVTIINSKDLSSLYKKLKKVERDLKKAITVLDREEL